MLAAALLAGASESVHALDVAPPARYRVVFEATPLLARVSAELTIDRGRLRVGEAGAWQLGQGDWGQFIANLTARTSNGTRVAVAADTSGGWLLDGGRFSGRIRVSYDVSMAYVGDTAAGPRTAKGYSAENGFFTITSPLFMYSGEADGPFDVEIAAPSGFIVTTAWARDTAASSNLERWIVPSVEALTENAVAITRDPPEVVRLQGYTGRMVLLGPYSSFGPTVAAVVRAEMGTALEMLPPLGDLHELLIFFPDPNDTGEALHASSIMSASHAPALADVALWGKTLAHEFVHNWVGHALRTDDWATGQWFTEGVTEYLASLTQYQAGILDEQGFLSHMRKHLHLYLLFKQGAVHDPVSLVAAGSAKAKNNAAIYDGGALAAFCYDGMLREASAGRYTLADAVAELLTVSGGSPLANDAIVEVLATRAGDEATEMYQQSIAGGRSLPLDRCFQRFGYHLGVNALDVTIGELDSPTPSQRLMRLSLRVPTRLTW